MTLNLRPSHNSCCGRLNSFAEQIAWTKCYWPTA